MATESGGRAGRGGRAARDDHAALAGGAPGRGTRGGLSLRTLLVVATWVIMLAMAGAAAAASHPNVLNPAGSAAHDIKTLTLQVFAILSLVLLTVWVLLAYVIIKGRRRPESRASQTAGNLRIEIVWTIIPAVIVALLFFLTVRTTEQLAFGDPSVRFTVVAHQWWWEFDFGPQGFKTANEVYVPNDHTLYADLRSVDVIHSFWVPQMAGKVQTIPGRVNHIAFTPLATGTYLGECSDFCGMEHARMRFVMKVVSPAEYAAWVQHQQQPAQAATGADAVAGEQLMPTIACGGCHTVRGTTMQDTFAPDLTHFGSRGGIGAYTLTNTPQNLLKWLQDPQAVKPGCNMPRIPLSLPQQQELVAYLEELK
ncbi:MAG TPA: cytochrome c oxidase subunit II [Thermoleophilia bacterium]|nr:cytochrome c oxidase subunit II [Thermoleophilia bacterium]